MRRASCFVVFLLSALYFCFLLGNRPFATPDEARYVEIPREMVATGDYLTPRLNGVKYFEKPPLFYWIQASAIKTLGTSEAQMRCATALLAALGVALTFAFATRAMGSPVGWMAAGILATSPLYFALAHMITLDMSVSVFVTLSLVCFYGALMKEPGSSRRRRFWLFSIACALGVMTKGVMALAIPGPIIVMWLTLTRQWPRLRPFYPISSSVLFLIIVLPWHLAVSFYNPEFAYKYFVVEHILRFTTTFHERYQPFWFFIPILLIGLFPWSAFLPAICKNFNNKPLKTYLLLWALWPLAFFSFSSSKLVPYILPIFPALAILLAQGFHSLWKKRDNETLKTGASIMLLVGIVGYFFPYESWNITQAIENFAKLMGLLCGVSGLISLGCLWGNKKSYAYATVGAFALASNMILIVAAPHAQKPSVKTLLTPPLPASERIVSYEVYFQDLPVYAQRIVTVVEAKGELTFGCTIEDVSSWMIDKPHFLDLWQSQERLWVVMKKESLAHFQRDYPSLPLYTYRQTPTLVLVSNKGEKTP